MITELNINKLIEETQTLCHDGRIEMAAYGERQVQESETEDGEKYLLKVSLTQIRY